MNFCTIQVKGYKLHQVNEQKKRGGGVGWRVIQEVGTYRFVLSTPGAEVAPVDLNLPLFSFFW